MKSGARVLVASILAAMVGVSSVNAQLEVVEEYTFEFAMAATPWEQSVMVPYYNPANHRGAPLEEVSVRLEGSANSEVDVTASGGDVIVLEGNVGAYISASGFVSGLVLDVFPSGSFAPPQQTIPNGVELNLTDITGSDVDELIRSGIANTSQFQGDSTYTVSVDSLGTSSLSTSGGNMDTSQRTNATAQLTIQYKITPVPEPILGAWVAGLFALGAAWRRVA